MSPAPYDGCVRRARPCLLMVVAVAGLTVVFATASPLHAEPIHRPPKDSDVVARVNGTAIYRKAVRDVVQGILAVQNAEREPDAATVEQLAADALESLVNLELLYQESQAQGIVVSDAAVDEEIARSKRNFPDAKSFAAVLKAKGMTDADLRRDTRKTMAVNRLLESRVRKDVPITPQQVQDFYDRHKEEFKHPAEIRASHIFIRVAENASPAERAAAKQRADDLLRQIKAGADFAQLAREQSQDPGSAARGGDLGFFAKGEMTDDFEQQAFALSPGQVSDVVATSFGFLIITVTDRRGAGYKPLDEVEARIRAVLVKTERQHREDDLVAKLREKAKIEIGEPVATR